jgi:hypothetical protein
MERLNFEVEDIIETVRYMSRHVTDDCTWAGVEMLACELLGCSEETLADMLEEE